MAVKKSGMVTKIAEERISILFKLAKDKYDTDPELSRSYVKLIRQISRHYKIKLDRELKNSICKECNSVLIPGKNLTVRVVSSKRYMLYRCTGCGAEKHIHY